MSVTVLMRCNSVRSEVIPPARNRLIRKGNKRPSHLPLFERGIDMTDNEIKAQSLGRAEHLWRIEIWTEALMRFATSVPIYEPDIWFEGTRHTPKSVCRVLEQRAG